MHSKSAAGPLTRLALQTALHLACSVNHLDTIQKLVSAGADPEAQDDSEKSPLDYVLSFLKKGEEHDDPIYAYLQSQLSKASLRNKTKVHPVDRALQQMQDASQAELHATGPSLPKHRSVRVGKAPLSGAFVPRSDTPGLQEDDSEDVEALVGELVAHEVAIIVDSKAPGAEPPVVFRTTRRTLMKKRNSRLAHAIELLDIKAEAKRERDKARGVEMAGRIMTEFRDRDPVLMSFILNHFEEGGGGSSSSGVVHAAPGTAHSPEDPALLTALMHEADFFQLPRLAKRCADALDLLTLRRVDPALVGRDATSRAIPRRERTHATIAEVLILLIPKPAHRNPNPETRNSNPGNLQAIAEADESERLDLRPKSPIKEPYWRI